MVKWLGTAAVALAVAMPCAAQGPQPSGTYPNVNRAVAIAPGETVQLLNQFTFDRGPAMRRPGKRIDFLYSTTIPAADEKAREEQADRAAQFFGAQALNMGAHRIAIAICDTRECAENRQPPSAWYQYERFDGKWRRVR